ncbi:uroporphyrinogen decarboxylase family protein [uncultured Desulfobacter sp.]|uniref:uroporphyrinogen decarboxylase family protein n=1 Tax=uncultured Desulfobacter sp. TaxID=240139 RepID=UPI002AAB0611|nr:uroporphyrinogen decarboxylase family protein [uncultured Desulfobacter sp.]
MENQELIPHTKEQKEYRARLKRVWDAVRLKQPDRVPMVILDDYFSLHQGGLTPAQAYYDTELAAKVFQEEIVKYGWDMVGLFAAFPGKVGEILGLTTNKWGGYNLPDTQEFQYVEKEYLLADEYDLFLKDPGDFTVRKLWPRMATVLEPFGLFPPLAAMSHAYAPVGELAIALSRPEVLEMLRKMIKAGEEMNKLLEVLDRTTEALKQKGLPVENGLSASFAHAPFDWVSDYLRGIRGSMMDMYYNPDKLKATIEVITPTIIDYAIASAKEMGGTTVSIPLHRGSDSFMSNAQFAEFYWPGLKKLLLALIEADLTPIPFFEGSYTNRLEFLTELPAGKVWGHFDVVDLKKARQAIGDTMCFWGNVPTQVLIAGTPEQTADAVKELIDIFGDTGGLIIDGSAGIPKEAKKENVMAMAETVYKYGVY